VSCFPEISSYFNSGCHSVTFVFEATSADPDPPIGGWAMVSRCLPVF